MKRALLYLLFLLFLAGGAAAYFIEDWREIAGDFAQDAKKTFKQATTPAPSATKKATAEKPAPTKTIAAHQKPAFDVARVDPEGTAIFAGRAEPGWHVKVKTKGQTLGETQADSNGDWIIMVEKPIEKGNHEFKLSARAPDGDTELSAADNIKLAVGVPDKAKEEVKTAAVEATPAPKKEEPKKTATASVTVAEATYLSGTGESGRVVAKGTAAPGETVRLRVGDKEVASVKADQKGNWVLSQSFDLQPGSYKLQVEQADATGSVTAKADIPFERPENAPVVVAKAEPAKEMAKEKTASTDLEAQTFTEQPKAEASAPQASDQMTTAAVTAAPETQSETMPAETEQPKEQMANAAAAATSVKKATDNNSGFVVIRRGDTLWAIAERHYGEGQRYRKIFKGNRGKIRNPHWIYPAQRFKLPE